MASRDVVLRRWEHSTGRSGASGACGTVVRSWFLTYLTTKQPCFHSFPCRVAPKSGAVGSRVLAGQRLKRADFAFQDPSRGFGTTTHVPSADPRTLQLHLRDFPFSPPPPPFFAPLQARTKARRPERAHTTILHPAFFIRN